MQAHFYRRAADCYRRADLPGEAARCYEAARCWDDAAGIYEEMLRWDDAARCWGEAKSRRLEARCRLRADDPARAVEALILAGEALEAAWIAADRLGHVARASRLVNEATRGRRTDEIAAELVIARCEIARSRQDTASRAARQVLRRVVDELPRLEAGPGQWRVARWAADLADRLERPDLGASVHAAAVRARIPKAVDAWENWALTTLGDADGIPRAEALDGEAEAL